MQLAEDILTQHAKKRAQRDALGDVLVELGRENPNVVVLDADLLDSTRTTKFAEQFPDRFVQVGVAEQSMAGIGAGLALGGKIPFITSFAVFNSGRNWEQIRLSICYSQANVKIVGTHAGLSPCSDGGSAQALEDIALMRVLPNMAVLSPVDAYETERAVRSATNHKGPVYIRIGREETELITTPNAPFEIGKAYILVEGKDVTIISTGPITYEAIKATVHLKAKYKIETEVLNCPTIKPLDKETILESVNKTGRVITLEEHQVCGGLGGAVAELLGEENPVSVVRLGVKDVFGESGTYKELKDKHGLSSHHVEKAVLEVVGRS